MFERESAAAQVSVQQLIEYPKGMHMLSHTLHLDRYYIRGHPGHLMGTGNSSDSNPLFICTVMWRGSAKSR